MCLYRPNNDLDVKTFPHCLIEAISTAAWKADLWMILQASSPTRLGNNAQTHENRSRSQYGHLY